MKLSVFYDHIAEAAKASDFNEVFDSLITSNISAVDINYDYLVNNYRDTMNLLERYGYEVSCIYQFYDYGHNSDLSKGKCHIDLANKVGAKKVLIVPGFLSNEDAAILASCGFDKEKVYRFMNTNDDVQRMKEALVELVAYAARQNVTVTLEDFDAHNAPFATSLQLLWFMENVNNLRWTFDMGNFAFSNEDVEDAYRRLKAYIAHVHCKDRGVEGDVNLEFNKGLAPCSCGSGYIPVVKLVSQLVKDGYDGYIAIEHFGSKNQTKTIMQSAEYLNKRIH